jgi:hypothetical protein
MRLLIASESNALCTIDNEAWQGLFFRFGTWAAPEAVHVAAAKIKVIPPFFACRRQVPGQVEVEVIRFCKGSGQVLCSEYRHSAI